MTWQLFFSFVGWGGVLLGILFLTAGIPLAIRSSREDRISVERDREWRKWLRFHADEFDLGGDRSTAELLKSLADDHTLGFHNRLPDAEEGGGAA